MKRKITLNKINYIALIVIIAGVFLSSLAYFTDNDARVNTFTVGKLKIELDEPLFDELEDNARTLLPGNVIVKDPTVTVLKESEEMFVFMNVVNKIDGFIEDLAIDTDAWELVTTEARTDGTHTLYVYVGVLADQKVINYGVADQVLEPLFTEITVIPDLDNEQFETFDALVNTLDVQAFAHQALIAGGINYTVAKDAAIAYYGY